MARQGEEAQGGHLVEEIADDVEEENVGGGGTGGQVEMGGEEGDGADSN